MIEPGAIPVDAGTVFKFIHEIKTGDYVIYPSKSDRMINIGQFMGEHVYVPEDPDEYANRQKVKWLGHFPRNDFSQSALNEIGSFLTLFRVKRHTAEFLSKNGVERGTIEDAVPIESAIEMADETEDDDTATVSVSRQAEETTEDFIVRRIMGSSTATS